MSNFENKGFTQEQLSNIKLTATEYRQMIDSLEYWFEEFLKVFEARWGFVSAEPTDTGFDINAEWNGPQQPDDTEIFTVTFDDLLLTPKEVANRIIAEQKREEEEIRADAKKRMLEDARITYERLKKQFENT
jgi:hypothetical protein